MQAPRDEVSFQGGSTGAEAQEGRHVTGAAYRLVLEALKLDMISAVEVLKAVVQVGHVGLCIHLCALLRAMAQAKCLGLCIHLCARLEQWPRWSTWAYAYIRVRP